ncbi:response regulator transcription factor [Mucilaginibacter rubeus]|uniref:Response regulator transcription factor n=2 Tax=Sphingobacteriaceae TaxID=84566 RepID=A0AAE6MLT1_9SPHI|nr:response regulator transcription factor [Mucilaginibacter rubeus]QEM20021.1 response regulator transcription factor [Mucilaginibacter gossypii]QTE43269.1 response regulator transcription factor [Mucilaginibacter rubeus]QTE49869.1 response regulator transcription factor [Mucilaginibacter rubeus]QTE54961.1 response regulator transcription factor [Mucilaginibacter rubeus]
MAGSKLPMNKTTKRLLGLGSLLLMTLLCVAFSFTGKNDFDMARQEILLRKIGHEVLLYSGDSTSRVMPVQKIAENEYELRFENEFSFQPDSLEKAIGSALAKDNLANDYIVNVLNCGGSSVIFGYAIFKNKKDNIMPCSGRKQPKSCYVINLKFKSQGWGAPQKGYLIGGIPLLAFIGLVISMSGKGRKNTVVNSSAPDNSFKIGNIIFNPARRQLHSAGMITELTLKENKLLLIFARSPNEIIERSRLQKEIWEDEGVIVGRSLDMFISKLRKKLEHDPAIKLVNIHGKGYKLEING